MIQAMKIGKRIIGDLGPKDSDTLVIAMAGLHGNEASGVKALKNIFETLSSKSDLFKGRFIGMVANEKGLEANKRFIDYDLNRVWTDEFLGNVKNGINTGVESEDILDILGILDGIDHTKYTKKIFIDLHTTKSERGMFILMAGDKHADKIAYSLATPVVLGITQHVRGMMIEYMQKLGFSAFSHEGGNVGSSEAIDNHNFALWQTLLFGKCVSHKALPEGTMVHTVLGNFIKSLPKILKVVYCHHLAVNEQFVLNPGYRNYDPIKKGETLGTSNGVPLQAPRDGYMLMPNYNENNTVGYILMEAL